MTHYSARSENRREYLSQTKVLTNSSVQSNSFSKNPFFFCPVAPLRAAR